MRSSERGSPTALRAQKFLAGLRYPARKHEILARARERGADDQVMRALLILPNRAYDSPISRNSAQPPERPCLEEMQ
jgi:hypothetical protein